MVPIGLESEPQMGQRVILASDVPRYVLEATLHGNGCTLTRGEYASSVVEPHEGAPATMLDLWQGGMLGTVVGLDGVGSLTRKRRQDLLMPREHRWMADALSFKSRHFVAQAQSALAAPLPPAVWLSKGRALATACVAWDGDCRQHAEERGEGSWGMSNVREGSDPDRVMIMCVCRSLAYPRGIAHDAVDYCCTIAQDETDAITCCLCRRRWRMLIGATLPGPHIT